MTSTPHFNAEIFFSAASFTGFYYLAFEQNYGKAQLDRHRLSAQNCRPETLVFSDISLVQVVAVFVVQTAIKIAYDAYIVVILSPVVKQGKITLCAV